MSTPVQLGIHELLHFNPGWIKDPPPWVLSAISKEGLIQLARIHFELQRNIAAAQMKALEGATAVLAKETGR
jgi:hypothetical protein